MKLLGATDELVAVHLGHVEVREQQIKGARHGLLNDFESVMGSKGRDDAVAARFQ